MYLYYIRYNDHFDRGLDLNRDGEETMFVCYSSLTIADRLRLMGFCTIFRMLSQCLLSCRPTYLPN